MLKAMRSRLNKDEGFTLIELMVVVLIIAILVAIAIPTFLGQRKNAQDSAAKSNVRNALATEKAYFSVNQAFTATTADLAAIEPNLFGTTAADPVTATVGTNGVSVCLTQQSDGGDYFSVWDGTNCRNHVLPGCDGSGSATCPTRSRAAAVWLVDRRLVDPTRTSRSKSGPFGARFSIEQSQRSPLVRAPLRYGAIAVPPYCR